jgi:hypothetical protein
MKTVIAKTVLYRNDDGPKRYTITIYLPERDPLPGGDFRCGVKISGDKIRYVHGIDSFQALNLAFVYIGTKAMQLLRSKTTLYHDKALKHEYDIKLLMLNDYRKFEKLSKNRNTQAPSAGIRPAIRK